MEDEHKLKEKLGRWTVEPPPAHLADSIVRRATAEPQQRQQRPARMLQFMERALSDWRYGLEYKAVGLALCAALGLAVGAQQTMVVAADEVDVMALAFTGNSGDQL